MTRMSSCTRGTAHTACIGLVATIGSFVGYAVVPYGWMIYGVVVLRAGRCRETGGQRPLSP